MTGADGAMVEVVPGCLWQSGRPVPVAQVEAAGINAIVAVGIGAQPWIGEWMRGGSVAVSYERPQLRVFLHIPLIDAANMLDPVAADTAIHAVEILFRDPFRRVLVHCDMGAFRSVHVAACVLAQVEGCDSATACRHVDAARDGAYRDSALSAPDWRAHAESYPRRADRLTTGDASGSGLEVGG